MNNETVKGIYARLITIRDPFLKRARACSKVTIPALIPEENHNSSNEFHTPYQSFGARAVNNLASKLLLALFPPNRPCFRLSPDEAELQAAIVESGDKELKNRIELKLKGQEQVILSELENSPFRAPLFEALKHFLVAGNILITLPKSGKVRIFPLDRYVCRRDPSGNIMEIITKEQVDPKTLPEPIRKAANLEAYEDEHKNKPVEIYTHIRHTGSKWEVVQEINETAIESTRGSYPLDALPYLALRGVRVDGEDYGRSLVEEHYGDLSSVEGLRQSLVEAAAAFSKVVFLVNPNGTTKKRNIVKAENGDVIDGHAGDVTVLQAEKRADLAVVQSTYSDIMAELAKAFLLNSSVQRNAERVTAEEVRYMARELEDTLGGVYSILSQELQLPFISIHIYRLTKERKLESMPDSIKPRILTGLEALGRTDERERMLMFLQDVSMLGNAGIARLDQRAIIDRLATQHQIDVTGLLKDETVYQQEQQQAQMAAMAERVGPNVVNGLMKQGQQSG